MLTTKTDPFYSRLRKEKVDPLATLHIHLRVPLDSFLSKMASSKTSQTASRIASLLMAFLHLGIAIWTSVLLGTVQAPSELLLAYVISECCFGYIGFLSNLLTAIVGKNNCCKAVKEVAGLGLFIWNCVLLFHTLGGIPQSQQSPYEYFVFVYFFINIAIICVGILAVCCMCCGLVAFLVHEDTAGSTPTLPTTASGASASNSVMDPTSVQITVERA